MEGRAMRVDVREKSAEALDNTAYLAETAKEQLAALIQDLTGWQFFGKTGVMLIWQAG